MNGGTCFQDASMPNFRECTCAVGYTGLDCETGENRMHQTLPVFHSVGLLFKAHTGYLVWLLSKVTDPNLAVKNKSNEFLHSLFNN